MTASDLLGQVHVAVIRLDAKMDGITAELRDVRDRHGDHESRLRLLEQRPTPSMEQVKRLEDRPYVSPATIWKVIGAVMTAAGIAIAIINLVVK